MPLLWVLVSSRNYIIYRYFPNSFITLLTQKNVLIVLKPDFVYKACRNPKRQILHIERCLNRLKMFAPEFHLYTPWKFCKQKEQNGIVLQPDPLSQHQKVSAPPLARSSSVAGKFVPETASFSLSYLSTDSNDSNGSSRQERKWFAATIGSKLSRNLKSSS